LATIEVLEAYDWYELQKEGLGSEFLEELDRFIEQLLMNPNTHSLCGGV
jgi:toxin ParE1/3/4